MVGITDTPTNRRLLKNMTIEKWNQTALESQYRWILLCNKIVSEKGEDYLENIGVDSDEKARIMGHRNRNRQIKIIEEKRDIIETKTNLTQKNRNLKEQVQEHEEHISELNERVEELEEQIETERKESKRRVRELRQRHDLKFQELEEKLQEECLNRITLEEKLKEECSSRTALEEKLQKECSNHIALDVKLQEERQQREQLEVRVAEIAKLMLSNFNGIKGSMKETLIEIRNFEEENANYFKNYVRLNRLDSYMSDIDLKLAQFKELIDRVQPDNKSGQ